MIARRTACGPISQTFLLGISAVMVIPNLMPFLPLALPAEVNRWVNIVSGTLYTVIMILAIRGGWHFYIFYGWIEIVLTALIVRSRGPGRGKRSARDPRNSRHVRPFPARD